ncbi:MAG: choice-of-anchor Q domain-containing protein, partial [Kiritimatiellae bacterium]|nr:choice-of-anchor Q domain-containing protein [Kiritimatiellia bacterium]
DENRAQTTLFDLNASFRPGSLKGRCINPDTAKTLYRHAEIADNTATSITVWGKAEWASAGNGYRIYDFRLRQGSPAINAALATDAPATDLDGNPRPAMGGIDIGAFEAQPPQGTTIMLF